MSNSLTQKGQDYALYGDGSPGSDGGLARLAAFVKLYDSSSTPNKNGTGFNEVANGNGYTTGGIAISLSDWTLGSNGSDRKITLANKVWTASGGQILNVAGAYLTDASGNVLGWWERSPAATLNPGDTLTLSGLTVGLT